MKQIITGNEPAFPVEGIGGGLTIRQQFAAMAMQAGITADPDRKPEYIANDAVLYSDALIAELNK